MPRCRATPAHEISFGVLRTQAVDRLSLGHSSRRFMVSFGARLKRYLP